MHAYPPQHHLSPASLPPMPVPADQHLPWRLAPHAYDAAPVNPPDRAAKQWVWHSRFGTIVIEVRGNDVFVNGDRVAPHAP